MPSGGRRPGAGRKRKADVHAKPIASAEKRIADYLPTLIDNMIHLANGGYERVEEKFLPVPERDLDGEPILDEKGQPRVKLVSVERKVEVADKDRAANIYLIDRILGKTTVRIEHDGEVAAAIPKTLESMIEKLYGSEDSNKTEAHSDADE